MSGVERRGLPGLAFPEELLKREAHVLADPAGQPVEVVRGIRDDIAERVQRLLDELVPTS